MREQVGDHGLEPVGLDERGVEVVAQHLLVVGPRALLEPQAQGGQRRAQLVRDVGGELALAGDELGDALGAVVERLTDRVDLRDPRARRADREVAVAELRGGACDALEWS